ncbi:MAG: DNA methyltransferase [Succiniclasticum sp.]|uniref:DNA methyltransferase n=1 Tax=Succiniclasticum sp. TaxID=2775030 RepID=UPI002A91D34C|nr:DNA methyltransferase [Succiniclasticum sp.]MDY6291255.1 DNA methyltransferase [Succiniclasticum sp.]
MNDTEQRKAAKAFAETWRNKGDEKQHTQQFWSDLLHRVYGITDFSQRVEFEKRVPLEHTSFIDVYIPETHVIIEQKSLGIDLLKRKKQSDGRELNPFEQAQRYGGRLPYSERPRWIVTCNFQQFLIYDMNEVRPEEKPICILLEELPEKYHLLSFLLDASVKKITVEQQLSVKAGELVGKLYDLMLPQYKDPASEETLKSLNKFCVRIVFCLYAEDALLFGEKGSEFHDYLSSFLSENRRTALINLFRILDTPEAERDPYSEQKLLDFPYVNGGLFDGDIEIPRLTEEISQLILIDMSENLDWSKISPTIFGAVFESTLNPETRRSGGMHYTSIENIHKVIDPLFLEDLQNEYDGIINNEKLSKPKRKEALDRFHDKLASLYFLDPAAGSGNFLTESYLSLRRLENKLLEQQLHGLMVLEFANPVKVSIGQFAGIEINDFAVTVARTALWIAESQMIKETEAIVNQTIEFFPLKTDAKIVEGNALRMDWEEVVPKSKLNYIMGNPPFVGGMMMTKSQHIQLSTVFHGLLGVGELDYVTGWYKKASEFIKNTFIHVAFVSTNSICQGQQVLTFWKDLISNGVKVIFAYPTFKWQNEASDSANVFCIIVGFCCHSLPIGYQCKLFTNEIQLVDNINPYLQPGPNVFVESRNNPINTVPKMRFGSMPRDGGGFILNETDKEQFILENPYSQKWIRPYLGSREFLNNGKRWCLWLQNADIVEIRKSNLVLERIEKVRSFRAASKAAGTRKYADTPMVFCQIAQPNTTYIAVPKVSSERRKYIPMGFLPPGTIASDLLFIIPDGSLYHLGILESNVHMAWMRTVAGRLKSDYRYSKDIVYNNFPWPEPTEAQKEKIEKTAQGILDARAKYPEASLADLYDELTMPSELRSAHKANDRAVMEAYGMWGKVHSEAECVAWLFRLYQELTRQ